MNKFVDEDNRTIEPDKLNGPCFIINEKTITAIANTTRNRYTQLNGLSINLYLSTLYSILPDNVLKYGVFSPELKNKNIIEIVININTMISNPKIRYFLFEL